MKESFISVGIDLGTSTLQLIFSKITIQNNASSFSIPRIEISEKSVIYRSDIYFTPLIDANTIDMDAAKKIIENEYKLASIMPEEVKTGAVIITGETARRKNAGIVLDYLSKLAGNFVVATAGANLESVLSGKGAGIDIMSKENHKTIANLDIGGGTTNISVFSRGDIVASTCLDIGGRLVKFANGKISYIYHKIADIAINNNILINIGDAINEDVIKKLCLAMAHLLLAAVKGTPHNQNMYTNDLKPILLVDKIDNITFSGGVAELIYNTEDEKLKYGDIGVYLADAVKSVFSNMKIMEPKEKIRATVVGAGSHTTEISGSTICVDSAILPIVNIPVISSKILDEDGFVNDIQTSIDRYRENGAIETPLALFIDGAEFTSYSGIERLAQLVIKSMQPIIDSRLPIIVIIKNDIAKALGNLLSISLGGKDIIVIDGINISSGDYIDIGKPLAMDRVVPVIIKTIIFNS